MLNTMNANNQLQRQRLVYGEIHEVFHEAKPETEEKGWNTSLTFEVSRNRRDDKSYFISTGQSTPDSHGGGYEKVAKIDEWFMISFVEPAFRPEASVVARIVHHSGERYLEFMNAAAWSVKYGQVEVVKDAA